MNFGGSENGLDKNLIRIILEIANLWYESYSEYNIWNPTIFETCIQGYKYKNIYRSFSDCVRRINLYWVEGEGGAPILGDIKEHLSKELTELLLPTYEYIIGPDEVNKIVKHSMDFIEKEKNILNIIENGETETVEFKSTFKWDLIEKRINKELPKQVTKTVCAFLNSRGGTLFIGVSNDGRIIGLEYDLRHFKDFDNLQQEISKTIRENLGGSGLNVEVNVEALKEKNIIIIRVDPSHEAVFHLNKEFYVRRGTSSHSLNPKEATDYIKNHFKQ